MVLKKIVTLCLTLCVYGCINSQDMNWKDIETIGTEKNIKNPGLGTNYSFNKFKFISNNIGFFIGDYNKQMDIDIDNVTWNNINLNQDAIVLRSTDRGYHWHESILGKGEIVDFNKAGSDLLTLRKSYHGKEADRVISHIHTSKDQGKSWQEISQNEKDEIDQIHFWTINKGIGICGLTGYRYKELKILLTEDTGKNWKEIKLPKAHEKMDFALGSQGILYYLTKERTSYMQVDLNTFQPEEITLSGIKYLPYSVVLDNNEKLYFVAENDDKRNVFYQKTGVNSYKKIEFPFTDKMVFDVQIYDNTIGIINEDKDYYQSTDEGKTWTKESIGASYISDVAFYGKGHVWVRTFPGKMAVRTP